MRKLFIVRDEVSDVNVAKVLFYKDILADLISVDESAIDLESENELLESGLNFCSWFSGTVLQRCKNAE